MIQLEKKCEVIKENNYTAVKYPDGRSEYYKLIAVTDLEVNIPTGDGYYGRIGAGIFPSGLFNGIPVVNATYLMSTGNNASIFGLTSVSDSQAGTIYLFRTTVATLNGYVAYHAIGRWK